MQQAVEIFPVELTRHSNFGNYFLKYGAYTFKIDTKICDSLHNTFVKIFEERLKRFPKEDIEMHNVLVINRGVCPRYESYRIHH